MGLCRGVTKSSTGRQGRLHTASVQSGSHSSALCSAAGSSMAIWRTFPAAALAAVAAAAAATPAAAAAAVNTTHAALSPSGRQCTQAGDFPHHDGCSATVRGVAVPLRDLAGRWYMWDLSNDAKDHYKKLLRIGHTREVTCPTMTNTVKKGVGVSRLCMSSRARPGARVTISCAHFSFRRVISRGGRYDAAAPLVFGRVAVRSGASSATPVKILQVARWPGGRLKSFLTYACPKGNAPPKLPCVHKGPPEVVGVWTRVTSFPGLFASEVMSKRRLGIEALNEFQQLSCPKFRA